MAGAFEPRASLAAGVSLPRAPEISQPDLSVILAKLADDADGNFSVRLPGSWTGLAGKIADTFNDIANRRTNRWPRNSSALDRSWARREDP